MLSQLTIDFSTASPINKEKLGGQNRRLFEYLERGNTINIYSPAMKELKIGYLNSRCSDLRNKHGVIIFDRMVEINGTWCKEYSMREFL